MSVKTDTFIKTIGELARKEYISRTAWILPSVCIAQAALESGWNLNAKSLFGIKGKGFVAKTSEYVNGHYVTVNATFKSSDSLEESVKQYYDLITTNSRYKGAVNNPSYDSAIRAIKKGGYATSPTYVAKVTSIIKKYNLTSYDVRSSLKSIEEIADEIIAGKWGNSPDRKKALESAGYDYSAIQAIVNYKLGTTKEKSVTEIAKEVIAGKWGNGSARKTRLEAAGYDYNKVQDVVNKISK